MTQPHLLSDQVVIVTGGGRGIGRAIALRLAAAGANLVVGYLSREHEAAAVVHSVEGMGRQAIAIGGDLSTRAAAHTLVDAALGSFGRLDVVVCNHGILQQKPFLSITDEDLDRMLAVNLRGPFLLCQEALPHLQRFAGRIVMMSSIGAQVGGTLAVHYAATKAAIISLTRSMARLGAPTVRANCIVPGLVDTEMTRAEIASDAGRAKIVQIPLSRAGLADEVAETALFLASSASSYMTGQALNVNGGLYLG
jgi:acetoacetyl-CoA reductase/3-oxoacyl-[acyl-carrier protein] reductase